MSGSNPSSSIPGTQPSDRQPMVWQIPREHNLSGRNNMLSNPIDQENVQGDEEVMVLSEGDTNIDENVTIPNEAMIQDPPPLSKSQRVIKKSSRYLFVGESKQAISTEQIDDPNSYKEAINDVNADLWRLAMNTEMKSMYSNQVWELVDAPKGIKPIGSHYDYEVWQMDVKTAFLNGHLEECIYMVQPDGFVEHGHESKNFDEPCVYKKIQDKKIIFLVLYVDDILLIGNDVEMSLSTKAWLAQQFHMKDLGEASYILGIQILRDRKNKLLALSQATYIDKILVIFAMQDSKKGNLLFRHGIQLSKKQSPKTPEEIERMSRIPYALAVGSLMYAMLALDLTFVMLLISPEIHVLVRPRTRQPVSHLRVAKICMNMQIWPDLFALSNERVDLGSAALPANAHMARLSRSWICCAVGERSYGAVEQISDLLGSRVVLERSGLGVDLQRRSDEFCAPPRADARICVGQICAARWSSLVDFFEFCNMVVVLLVGVIGFRPWCFTGGLDVVFALVKKKSKSLKKTLVWWLGLFMFGFLNNVCLESWIV
ncbi:Retrovirus-related Pol polyprotein from transposon TNT 1-94 [Abeliophyllum distichum]|uniref:Retrovirus-related Pol polyprotein from transposon TNT 1-94 n=1 Tax=Abeliophyllum distichum TaxID=126358 RepID=A0ABD1QHG6_9LAMI